MRLKNVICALGLALVMLAALPCRAGSVTVTTSSGQVGGTFKSANGKAVVVEIATGREVTVPWTAIQKIVFGQKVLIEGPGFGKGTGLLVEAGATIAVTGQSLQLPPPGNELAPLSEIRSIAPVGGVPTPAASRPTDSCVSGSERGGATWYSAVAPKFTLTEGTQSAQAIGGSAVARRAQNISCSNWHHQETTLTIDANNTLTEQVGTPSIRAHEYDASISQQIYLTTRLYTEIVGEGFHNSSFNLYLEQSYGGGLGGRVVSNGMFTLELSAGALFVGEHFTTTKGVDFAAGRLGERFDYEFGKKSSPIVLSESTSYMPALDQAKAWQLRAAVELAVPITSHLSFVSGFLEDYMENAANGRKSYSTTTVGLNFSVGQN